MAQVGSFPGVSDYRRQTIKAPDNPMDRCTIFSIYPREINETKCTIQPGKFILPAGSYESPASLIVGSSSWWKEIDEDSPLLEIPQSSIIVAESIVKDYCNGMLTYVPDHSSPGIFFIPGIVSVIELKSKYKNQLDKAKTMQDNWYRALVLMGDSDWAKSNGNPLAVDDNMRLAARELGLEHKEWLSNFEMAETVRCVACGQMRNPLFPMCGNCKTIIDVDKFKKLGLKQVE